MGTYWSQPPDSKGQKRLHKVSLVGGPLLLCAGVLLRSHLPHWAPQDHIWLRTWGMDWNCRTEGEQDRWCGVSLVAKTGGSIQSEEFVVCAGKMGPQRMEVNEGGGGWRLALRMALVGYTWGWSPRLWGETGSWAAKVSKWMVSFMMWGTWVNGVRGTAPLTAQKRGLVAYWSSHHLFGTVLMG